MCKEGQSESRHMGGEWTTSKISSEVSMGWTPQRRVEIAKAAPSNLTLKEDPEHYFCGGKVVLEGFITAQRVSATWLSPFPL